ncbi:hypothetical protein MNBD_NITROSPIRAE03-758, partial [hydrothermal vent metagenome]
MYKNMPGKLALNLFLFLLVIALSACGSKSSSLPPSSSGTGTDTGTGATVVGTVSVAATPTSVTVGGTSSIEATVKDSNGANVPDGTDVAFSVSDSSLGAINPVTATTINGVATATLTATGAGTLIITAAAGSVSNTVSVNIQDIVATVSVTATPATVTVGGTSSIKATVLDGNGNNVPDGTEVSFSLSDTSLGAINPQANTYNGVAIATFTAGLTSAGTVTITATTGSVSSTVSVSISGAAAGSIEFSSAVPQVIGIKGTGQTETSTITFLVKDVHGNPVVNGTSVTFTMTGLNGGEYLDPLTTSTVNGEAVTFLHSGYVAGPVMIKASVVDVNGEALSSSSAPISIGGGVPTSRSFTLLTDVINLPFPCLNVADCTANITALVADRFGNYNVLKGTSVSFYTEAGAIDRNVNLDSTGAGSVIFRSQNPMPADVVADAYEAALQTSVSGTWPTVDISNNPRDGWVTILATVMGEESFEDANANGIYDRKEGSTDYEDFTDIGEPFIDKNDNGVRDDGTGSDPFEEYIDVNENGQYDGPNGCWDGPDASSDYTCTTNTGTDREMGRMIFQSIKLMVTEEPVNLAVSPTTFTIADGGSQTFKVIVADTNLNSPSPGTTISVSADGGKLSAHPPSPVPDGLTKSPVMFNFTLSDSNAGD